MSSFKFIQRQARSSFWAPTLFSAFPVTGQGIPSQLWLSCASDCAFPLPRVASLSPHSHPATECGKHGQRPASCLPEQLSPVREETWDPQPYSLVSSIRKQFQIYVHNMPLNEKTAKSTSYYRSIAILLCILYF